ncbi:hypothetical protein [Streptomyces sp. NPDC018833]|uniref:hypothetical protein n=1 Tax=Streptomyces sp. NPDC018833 TaxID=3365053 RepID=UPI0037A6984D
MNDNGAPAPAVAALEKLYEKTVRAVERTMPSGSPRDALVRQLTWVKGDLMLALELPDYRERYGGSLRDLLGPGADPYLDLAGEGVFRRQEHSAPRKAAHASQRVRRKCLRRFAEEAKVPCGARSMSRDELKPTLPNWARAAFRNHMTTLLENPTAWSDGRTSRLRILSLYRMLAIVNTVLDTAARGGELQSQTLDSLAPSLAAVKVVRRPQARRTREAVTEIWPTTSGTQAAYAAWLGERQALVVGTQGGKAALWVSVHHSPARGGGAGATPPGTPLQARGLARAYEAQIMPLKEALTQHGGKGWELPKRMEQLRRGAGEYIAQQAEAEPDNPRWRPIRRLPAVRPEGQLREEFGCMERAVREFQAVRADAEDEADPAVMAARGRLAAATLEAWVRGAGHVLLLRVLAQAGLASDDVGAAGYHPQLLTAAQLL